MPRIRQPAKYHHLSQFERGRVTVLRCWLRRSEEGPHERRRGSGRPRTTTAREERYLKTLALRDTIPAMENHWLETLERRLSMAFIYRRIRSYGLRSYRTFWCLLLTPRHRARRLE